MGLIDEIQAIDHELSSLPPRAFAQSSEQSKLTIRLEEVWGSCALAGAALTLPQTRLLLQRGIVGGDRVFRDYLMVWGYGQASAWVQAQRPRSSGSRISVAEVRHLHTRAASGAELVESGALPGVWRTQNAGNVRAGMIPLPPALIVGELTALVDRFGHGPPVGESLFIWLARFQSRFERIRPFASANGRVGRLCVNLMLTRFGLPFATVTARTTRRYRAALTEADAGDPFPLARFIAGSVQHNVGRLAAPPPELRPLSTLAGPATEEALRKAVIRGRLRHVYVGTRLFSTIAWRDEYLASREVVRLPQPTLQRTRIERRDREHP